MSLEERLQEYYRHVSSRGIIVLVLFVVFLIAWIAVWVSVGSRPPAVGSLELNVLFILYALAFIFLGATLAVLNVRRELGRAIRGS